MIKIKPHHFIDIIKLYGSGIEEFVPDKNYNHDFYRIANEIISNPDLKLRLTVDADDICNPCKYKNLEGICSDSINHIELIKSKDQWNKILDHRILEFMGLSLYKDYSARELCSIISKNKLKIYEVWKEEDKAMKKKRYNLFFAGVIKYLKIEV